jgi:hypothetical protein
MKAAQKDEPMCIGNRQLILWHCSLFFSRNRRLAEDFERYATTIVAIPGSEQLNVDTEVTRERLRASRFWRVSRNM